jgi:SAM-dependent methyltransferase
MSEPAFDDQAFRRFELAGWNRVAEPYHDLFGPVTGRMIEPLLDEAGVRAGTRVLEVASGPGDLAVVAAQRGATVTGVDISASMVALAARRCPGASFQEGDAEELPFADSGFEAVVSNFGIGHFPRPEKALEEFARVTVRGGCVAVTWWDYPETNRFSGLFTDAMRAAGAAPPPGIPAGPPMARFSDPGELAAALKGAGLSAVRIRTISFMHTPTSSDALWDDMMDGSVLASAAILGQPAELQHRIRQAYDRLCTAYLKDGRLELPIAVHLASGRVAVSAAP